MRPRAGSAIDQNANRPPTRASDENRSPTTLPRAFEGMLKTATETGDIGMFSIKPSRLPQSMSTPRRIGASYNEDGLQNSRQQFQPFGVPNVDDRRRLPSYARDATSEVISMYETASQKSASRVFDDPDYRSYSMTQTSYSAYTLSNHRSYASLRTQQDNNGLLQRPRSPFAYPARLKRPGFRPSSPALTDDGVVDYSRRAEIDRATYVSYPTFRPSLIALSDTLTDFGHKSLRHFSRKVIVRIHHHPFTLRSGDFHCPFDTKQTGRPLLFSASPHLHADLQVLVCDKVTES
jgi:hypothetical protein